ncbi:MAG: FtsX-like permease family protein [Planctomycetia bacterium]|nr:FtsX-like permease family protein [Planctomycetia bacterium]
MAARDYIAAELRRLKPDALLRVPFNIVTLKTDLCEATIVETGKKVAIYPVWPNSIRLSTTPAGGIRARPIYIGDGTPDKIHPLELRGSIAVMDWNSQDRWLNAAACGAVAIIFLEPEKTISHEGYDKYLRIPANVPRFYLRDKTTADALVKGEIKELQLVSKVRWLRKDDKGNALTADNIYALFKGTDKKYYRDCMVIQARVDSASPVPDLSPGAEQALAPAVLLEMARQISLNRPAKSVLVVFTTADIFLLRGAREMMLALNLDAEKLETDIETLGKAKESAKKRLAELRTSDVLERFGLIETLDTTAKAIAQEAERKSMEILPRLEELRLSARKDLSEELKKQIEHLVGRKRVYDGLRMKHSRAKALGDSPTIGEQVRTLAEGFASRHLGQLSQRLELLKAQQEYMKQIKLPLEGSGKKKIDKWTTKHLLVVGLEISTGNNRWGAFAQGSMHEYQVGLYPYGARMRSMWLQWPEDEFKASYEADVITATRHWSSYMPTPMANVAEVGTVFAVPSFCFSTINDFRAAWDSPLDVPAEVRMEKVAPQAGSMWRLLWQLADDKKAYPGHALQFRAFQSECLVVGRTPGVPVPTLPISDVFITVNQVASQGVSISQPAPREQIVGARWLEWFSTDEEGRVLARGLPASVVGYKGAAIAYRFEGFTLGDHGEITWSSDHGQAATENNTGTFSLGADLEGTRTVMFECEGVSVFGFLDARYLETLGGATVLDAARSTPPRFYAVFADRGAVTMLLRPKVRWKLLMSRTGVGIRMMLIDSSKDDSLGKGFAIGDVSGLPPTALQSARDVYNLNDARIKRLRSYGIKSEMLVSDDEKHPGLHQKAAVYLEDANKALENNESYATVLRHAIGALANEARAYASGISTSDDAIKAVIFLLIGLVPFAFCMERLLFGSPNIYMQIVVFGILLLIMAFVLYVFHPAFRITTMPMVIILAFTLLLLSSIVIIIVYGKFQVEMRKLRGERVLAHTTSLSRGSVVLQAIMLGIDNMRKRRTRTTLTLVTLSLVTFVLLCFTSIQTYVSQNVYSLGEESRYPGILVRQQGWLTLPRWALDYFRTLYPDLPVAGRYWLVSTNPKATVLYTISKPGGKSTTFAGLLGLEGTESDISGINKVLGNWKPLAEGKNVCYLPAPVAKRIDAKVGQELMLFGEPIRVAGIFEPQRPKGARGGEAQALSDIRLLTGESFTPVDFKETTGSQGGAQQTEMVGGRFVMRQYEHIAPGKIIIVPDHLARRYGAKLTSVAIRAPSYEAVKAKAEILTERTTFPVFAGLSDGVKVLSSTTLATAKGETIIIVPMIIGALIILNTMLGSVAERRREIHIYTSLGLAPLHVAALFIAEAAAFGVMGAMLGYVLGQGLATAITHFGVFDLPDLNYSSMSAISTMMLVVVMVLVSSLYPARMAFKEAAPSSERTWSVPLPKGDIIEVELPFTINALAARGMCAFLWEWLDEHTEASIGDFATGWLEPFHDPASRIRGLRAQVWIAPFDLGIVQVVNLSIEPTEIENIYRVMMHLERRSGRPGPWHRLNKLFLREVRKQFLLWRALNTDTVKRYIEQSDSLFRDGKIEASKLSAAPKASDEEEPAGADAQDES